VDLILVDYPNGNPISGCIDAKALKCGTSSNLNIRTTLIGLVDSLLQDIGCIVFIQRANVNYVG
jgi:hypothetical protein